MNDINSVNKENNLNWNKPIPNEAVPSSPKSLVDLAVSQVSEALHCKKLKSIGTLPVFSNPDFFTAEQINTFVAGVKKGLDHESSNALYKELAKGLAEAESCSPRLIRAISDEQFRLEVVKHMADIYGWTASYYIQNFRITNPDHLFEIAKIDAARDGRMISQNIQKYKITSPEHLFEIAKIAAAQNGKGVSKYIQNYGITNPEHLFEIAKIATIQDSYSFSRFIQNYGIKNPEHLFELAKINAARDAKVLSQYIQNYGITNPEQLFEIAKIAAAKDGEVLSQYIQNYGIKNPEHLFEIAKIAAAQDGEGASKYIQNYGIKNSEHLYQIAKIAAAQDGVGVSKYIQNFFPLIEEAKMKIFSLAFRQSKVAIESVSNYEFKAGAADLLLKALRHLASGQQTKTLSSLKNWSSLHGFDLEKTLDAIEKEKNTRLQEDLTIWLIYTVFHLRNLDREVFFRLENSYNLLEQIFTCRQPELRYSLSDLWRSLITQPDFEARFDQLKTSTKDHRLLASLLLIGLENLGIPPKEIKKYSEILKRSDYSDKLKLNSILGVLELLQRQKSLDNGTKRSVLERLFNDPKAIHTQASFLQAILECGGASRLQNQEPLQKILEEFFKETVPLGEIESFAQKWNKNISGHFRRIPLLSVYAGKLSSQPDSRELLKAYADFLRGVLEGDFKERRYRTDNNPHLKTLSSKMDLEPWKLNSEVAISGVSQEEVKAATVDFKKILQDKVLTDNHLDPEKVLFLKRVLEGEEVTKVNLELGQALKLAKDKTLFRLQSYLIKLAQGQEPQKSLESVKEIFSKMSGFDDFKHDIEGMIQILSKIEKPSKDVFTLVSTDDPCDLFLCGSEVEGSCQRIEGDANLNKCLLGYCLNGANRLIAIKNDEGKIVARTMLRLLWDESAQTPVLFQERIYPSILKPEHEEALLRNAKETALRLGLPLTSLEGEVDYPNTIKGLGGPAPYEYTDAGGGVKAQGCYEITQAKIVPLKPVFS